MRIPKRLIALSLTTASLFGLAATPAQAAPPPRMVVIGDSLVSQMCGHELQAIPTREVPVIDGGCWGWSGATSGGMFRKTYEPGWVDPANRNQPTNRFNVADAIRSADVIVIGLGTNNAIRQETPQYLSWDVDNFVRLANGKPIFWFDLGVRTDVPNPIMGGSQFASAVRQNDVLWAKARQYPNLHVMAWGGQTGPHPEYLIGDGVHLTDSGVRARWAMVRDAIRS